LQKYTVESGDKVKRGQIIGFVGNSGRSTGAHLHYEVTLKNKPVNPYQLMKVANNYKKNNSKTKKKKSR
jgi:murein DD-endopeptidase MepM/ murein hydrolase activator NlpD